MATFNPVNDFFEQVAKGVHNWGTDTFKVALSNTAPDAADVTLADIMQIAAGNGYTTGGTAIANITVTETSGTATVDGDDVAFTASGGAIATFRYIIVYNDSASSPADALVGWVDNGSAVDVPDGQAFTVIWNAAGIMTFAVAA